MATIDLIVLGMLRQQPMSAYDIQKLVEYRKISKWVKISTPSIYKKVIQLEEKGFVTGKHVKESNFAEKVVYSLTHKGVEKFEELMQQISEQPINMFLDFNAVVVNLMNLSKQQQMRCIESIKSNIESFKKDLSENILLKEKEQDVPELGMAVLYQQYALAEALDKWIESVK